MIALEEGIVWEADVVILQEPVVEREGCHISLAGYRLVRGGITMTAIRRDTHLEILEVGIGGAGDVHEFDVEYTSECKITLVNVYDHIREVEGVRSQGRPAQTARWDEIMGARKILLGGDWNAHSDRWDPECPPRRDEVFPMNLMNTYRLTDVTDGDITDVTNRLGKLLTELTDFFITNQELANGLEISMDLTATSDHAVVRA
jgi:hypothetical protein